MAYSCDAFTRDWRETRERPERGWIEARKRDYR